MTERESFGSSAAAIMALACSAVGLGNIWRFPYLAGEYGGCVFIIIYLLCSCLLALPIFFSESIIGRKSGLGVYSGLEKIAPGTPWKYIAYLILVGNIIFGSTYSVVGGWTLDYLFKSCTSGFVDSSPETIKAIFTSMTSSRWEVLIFHTIFISLGSVIVLGGVKVGIERFTKATFPALYLLIIGLMVYVMTFPGSGKGVAFLLHPDFSRVTIKTVIFALGQSFYSLSLGVGMITVYSSYMRQQKGLIKTGLMTASLDTMFALLACFTVIPAVFAAGIAPNSGPSLVFESLPYIFATMGTSAIGRIVTIVFFLELVFAALTSEISMLEICVSHFMDKQKWSRSKSVLVVGLICWTLGVICTQSMRFFTACDALVSNFFMITGGLLMCLFVGWYMRRKEVEQMLSSKFSTPVYLAMKWLAPATIIVICIFNFLD